jgi:hypothetical protein
LLEALGFWGVLIYTRVTVKGFLPGVRKATSGPNDIREKEGEEKGKGQGAVKN